MKKNKPKNKPKIKKEIKEVKEVEKKPVEVKKPRLMVINDGAVVAVLTTLHQECAWT